MKTSNVLIRLLILTLLFTPFLTTTEASAQPPCTAPTPCGTPGNCYAAPKVECNDQLSHLITSSCAETSNAGLCDPGLFICISSTIPDGWSCGCAEAGACKYINIRNLYDCDPGGSESRAYPIIEKVDLRLTKDGSSSKYVICGPYKQWALSPWTDD